MKTSRLVHRSLVTIIFEWVSLGAEIYVSDVILKVLPGKQEIIELQEENRKL